MNEFLEEYKNIIINYDAPIVTFPETDEWTGSVTEHKRYSTFNGFSSPEKYNFKLKSIEREFLLLRNNHDEKTLLNLKKIKDECHYILTFLDCSKNEYDTDYYHANDKDESDEDVENPYYIQLYLKCCYESVQRVLVFVNDELQDKLNVKIKSPRYSNNNADDKFGFLQSETKFTLSKITKIYDILKDLELIECDKNTFNYWFRFDPENQKKDTAKIIWKGGQNSLAYFIREIIQYQTKSKVKKAGKWSHADNVFEFTHKNGAKIDVSQLIGDRSGNPALNIKIQIDSLK